MTSSEKFSILVLLIGSALTAIGYLIKVMTSALVKWTQTEDRLSSVADDLHDLVESKDRDHSEIKARLTKLEQDQLDFYRRQAHHSSA